MTEQAKFPSFERTDCEKAPRHFLAVILFARDRKAVSVFSVQNKDTSVWHVLSACWVCLYWNKRVLFSEEILHQGYRASAGSGLVSKRFQRASENLVSGFWPREK